MAGLGTDEEDAMADDRLVVIANQYDSEADALADFEDLRRLYDAEEIGDTFDAAVLTRKPNGKVDIVKRVSQPTRHGAGVGLGGGLALGAALAVFPAISLAGALVAGGTLGAGAGAIAGHMVSGMSRSDLKDLGEVLDNGTSGLVVVAATNVETMVKDATKRTKHQAEVQLQADVDAMKKELATI
jgi:uncharacterized membrane protein